MATVPPIKSQGIKTKLVDWIGECASEARYERWVEPFMGTGVVAFSLRPKSALLCDSNPHLIAFYQAVQSKRITGEKVRRYLAEEGKTLLETEGEYYYSVRERFNSTGNPLDFLFLSRSCFNGMMRFNKKGGFNVPFCRKPNRFAQALITKIANQVDAVSHVIETGDFQFQHQEFRETLPMAGPNDLVYCDIIKTNTILEICFNFHTVELRDALHSQWHPGWFRKVRCILCCLPELKGAPDLRTANMFNYNCSSVFLGK